MSVKHQIFISSTYDDLIDERAAVIKAILEMGHIPVGMEMFSAADEEQWKIITRQIDETDYYVLISGHRYGSMTGGISYTEKEFDYAISKGVPIYSFLADKSVEPLAKNVDADSSRIALLEKFRLKAKQRPVGFWKSAGDLHGMVSIALMKAFNNTPRPGWTRTTSVVGPEVMQELSRLSKENAELREQILRATDREKIDHRALLNIRSGTLKAATRTLALRRYNDTGWEIEVQTTLFRIFTILSTEMMVEISLSEASSYLGLTFNPDAKQQLSTNAPVPLNFVRDIFADLSSMDLIEPSKKKHAVSDKEEYWSLSNDGREMLKIDRLMQLESIELAPPESSDSKSAEMAISAKSTNSGVD